MHPLGLLTALLVSAEPPAAKLVIDFAKPEGAPAWYSLAVEQLVSREVSRFHRLELVDPIDTTACPGHDGECVAKLYAARGVDFVVVGRLARDELQYEVHETWSPARAYRGAFAVAGANVTTSRLQHRVTDIVRPIVASGGLLDKKPAKPEAPAPAEAPRVTDRLPLTLLFGALLVLTPLPLLVLLLLLRKAARPTPTWKWSAAAMAGLGLLLVAPAPGASGLVLPIAGGLLWGGLAVFAIGVVLPPLHGLSRVRHDALGPLLRAWLALCCLRSTFVVAALPVFSAVAWAAHQAGLEQRLTYAVLFPLVGLWGVFWLLSWVDNLSAYLDARLVDGPASERNLWHATARKYFMGYVKRQGVLLDRGFLERALFLPAKPGGPQGVVFYGGGLTRPRILIGAAVRELALGELPDEPEAPERETNPEELPLGFVVPQRGEVKWAKAEKLRRLLAKARARPRAPPPRLLGEPATALGWILPQPVDVAVPLISNSREDYEVVKSLLTEHYSKFEKNLDEDEHDDTDPSQRDFLFGGLLIAAGGFTRGDHLFSTVGLALEQARARASWPSRQLLRAASSLYVRFLQWPSATVADAFAALNGGLHHTFQLLSLSRGADPAEATARADAPRLIELSKRLLEGLWSSEPEGADRQLFRPTPRNRALWLAPFFYARLAPRRGRWLTLVLGGAAAAAALGLAFVAVRDAMEYRPRYVERMTQLQTMAAEAQTKGATTPQPKEP